MILSIIGILFSVAAILALFGLESKKKYFISGSLLVLSTLLASLTIVPTGATGVRVTFGRVSEQTLDSGLHAKVPFVSSIKVINNKVQRVDVGGEAASKDLQTVGSNVSVNYNVIGADASRLYKTVGNKYEETIIRPAVQESLKSTMAKFTAEELITKRSTVSISIKETLRSKLEPYGVNVAEFNIIDMNFSPEFNAAIEAKQTAQQSALKAEQDLNRIEVEARQKIIQAQADADANRIRSESITDKILTSEFLSKWDGKLPTVSSGDGVMIDISGIIGK